MKFSFLFFALVVACSKPSGSSKNGSPVPDQVTNPGSTVDVADPMVTPDPQQQDDREFQLERTYNGANVILNYNSNRNLGMIRIKGKDAEKLHKHMALSTIKLRSEFVKNDIEAKVGKHVMCRPDMCWIYVDYKNGTAIENLRTSEEAKAPRIIFTYRGPNLELRMIKRVGIIKIEGMDAKALYSVMSLSETETAGKRAVISKKSGDDIECTRSVSDKGVDKTVYKCQLSFHHRSGAMKDTH